ncbi:hypothetical protein [Riemerella anatipestifer]|uniref:hypothetical protein n=1 Tax=Riemerella anatipestifer TaxID=34085 RepID=UPI001374B61B|nr:hypothetical protein [Riemerella anatipestifer]
MKFNLSEVELYRILIDAEQTLFSLPKIKFERDIAWRKNYLIDSAGIYALFEKDDLIYIGETGNLIKRMSDITRTFNHTFRKQLGKKRFSGTILGGKFDDNVEALLDNYFDNDLYVSFMEVNFGRLEIEDYLVDKYKYQLLNSEKKRKFKYNYELIKELENSYS